MKSIILFIAITSAGFSLIYGQPATINNFEIIFEINTPGSASKRIHKEVTVYNQEGIKYATPYVYYDKYTKVKDFSCALSSPSGDKIKKFKSSEILDESITSRGTIFDDNRIKYIELNHATFPYVVSFEYEVEYDGLFQYPSFTPQPDYNIEVEQSLFEVSMPPEMEIRYKSNFSDGDPTVEKTDKRKYYRWILNNLSPVKKEVLSPDKETILPAVYLAANDFEYGGYDGNMNTWKDFGQWLFSLSEDDKPLDETEITEIKKISDEYNDKATRVKALYEYMQSKTRYVSVQLGIGGYKPMPANLVSQLGYGDCKGLSNYMQSILSNAGISSHYMIIGAGRNHPSFSFTDFPNSFQANHAILAVPLEHDTLFLECTDQNNPCGYLGSFTGNRKGLLVSKDGGYLVPTTSYDLNDYLKRTEIYTTLNARGDLEGKYLRRYHNVAHESIVEIAGESTESQRNHLYRRINLTGLEVNSTKYTFDKSPKPCITEEFIFEVPAYGQVAGTRMFLDPKLEGKWGIELPENENRIQPIHINEPIFQIDSILIKLPLGYIVETLPESVYLENEFGQYLLRVDLMDDEVLFQRTLRIYRRKHDAQLYPDLRSFFKKMVRADNSQIILIQE